MSKKCNTQHQPQTTHAQGILYGWKEIAAYIGCCKETAQKYAATQKLPVKKVAGRIMISKAMVQRWLLQK